MPASNVPYVLREAGPENASSLHALKQRAFGETFLPFTIYRSPKSVSYLRRLIERSGETGSTSRVTVATQGEKLAGYYMASPLAASYFLSYIAVDNWARGQNLGSALLEDFEGEARRLGYRSVALDVFVSNHGVSEWYARHGYRPRALSHAVRLDLKSFDTSDAPADWLEADWRRALANEEAQGFAKFAARSGNAAIEVGLIDGCAVKLLAWEAIEFESAANAVAAALRHLRSELILIGSDALPHHWPCIARQQSLRLERVLA